MNSPSHCLYLRSLNYVWITKYALARLQTGNAEIAVGAREALTSAVSESQCKQFLLELRYSILATVLSMLQFIQKTTLEQTPDWSYLASGAYCNQQGGEGEMTSPTQPAVPALIPPHSLVLWSLLVKGPGKAALDILSICLVLFGLRLPCAVCNSKITILDQHFPENQVKCHPETWIRSKCW